MEYHEMEPFFNQCNPPRGLQIEILMCGKCLGPTTCFLLSRGRRKCRNTKILFFCFFVFVFSRKLPPVRTEISGEFYSRRLVGLQAKGIALATARKHVNAIIATENENARVVGLCSCFFDVSMSRKKRERETEREGDVKIWSHNGTSKQKR